MLFLYCRPTFTFFDPSSTWTFVESTFLSIFSTMSPWNFHEFKFTLHRETHSVTKNILWWNKIQVSSKMPRINVSYPISLGIKWYVWCDAYFKSYRFPIRQLQCTWYTTPSKCCDCLTEKAHKITDTLPGPLPPCHCTRIWSKCSDVSLLIALLKIAIWSSKPDFKLRKCL